MSRQLRHASAERERGSPGLGERSGHAGEAERERRDPNRAGLAEPGDPPWQAPGADLHRAAHDQLHDLRDLRRGDGMNGYAGAPNGIDRIVNRNSVPLVVGSGSVNGGGGVEARADDGSGAPR